MSKCLLKIITLIQVESLKILLFSVFRGVGGPHHFYDRSDSEIQTRVSLSGEILILPWRPALLSPMALATFFSLSTLPASWSNQRSREVYIHVKLQKWAAIPRQWQAWWQDCFGSWNRHLRYRLVHSFNGSWHCIEEVHEVADVAWCPMHIRQ